MYNKDIKIKTLFSLIIFLLINDTLFAQRGKDGNPTISTSSVVNVYTSLPPAVNVAAGTSVIPVVSSTGFAAGDLIYIIQVQGATVNCFPEAINPNNSQPSDFTYGTITAYNNCGNNEFAQVFSVTGNTINIDCSLQNSYTGAGKVQVIRVPRYNSLTINSGGTITCPAWNGTTGGIIAIEVLGNTTINSGGAINASSLGFRGGMVTAKTVSSFGGGAWGHMNKNEGACKGESIVGDTTLYGIVFAGKFGKGAVANGGGGGSTVNGGGGGGANGGVVTSYTNGFGVPNISLAGYVTAWNLESAGLATVVSSGGGRGGYTFSQSNSNPVTTAPGNGAWSGDNRRVQGGLGGRPLDYSTGRLFIGGAGGAGDHENNYGGRGGNGGGIINIISYGNITGAGLILANGENGANTNTTGNPPLNNCNGRDGAGGGGGGGAIKINCAGSITTVTISANGGNGGNQQMKSGHITGSATMAYGPGGGGGGGVVLTTPAAVVTNVLGGANGIVQYISGTETCQIDNNFPQNGATSGGVGTTATTLTPEYTLSVSNASICTNAAATLTATSNNPSASFIWFSNSTGATQLGTGAVFTTSTLATAGTYTVYVEMCPGNYRIPATITVSTGPTLTVNSPTICSGQTTTLTVSGASTYTWSTGSNSTSIVQTPTATTVFTVSGTSGGCAASITSTINVLNNPTVVVNSGTICTGGSVTLTASGASTYSWNTGPTTVSISVSPTTTTIYTVTGTSGICSASVTSTVNVVTAPTVAVNSATVCRGVAVTLTASGASSYVWNTGPITSTISVSPTLTTVYTVTGSIGTCTASTNATVNIVPLPTVAVNSSSICSGSSVTLTASGATTYSWNTGPTSASIAVSPTSTTVYTVTGTSGICSSSVTSTVNVIATPTVAVNSNTVCLGGSVTLTASGASTYSWNTGPTTNTISISPTVTTIYTVTGTNGANCVDTETASVIVFNKPIVTLNANTFNICGTQIATIVATASSGTYSWSSGATTSVITTTVAGVYNVTVTNQCGETVESATVNVGSAPAFTIVPSASLICNNNNIILNTAGSTGTINWSTGALNTPSISVNTSGIYTATLTNACGTAVYSLSVSEGPGTSFNLSASATTLCAGNTVSITASGTGTFVWSTGDVNTSVITVTNTGIYTATISNACGTGVSTIAINNGPVPSISLTTGNFCTGQTASITASGSSLTYSWSSGATGPVLTTTAAGIYSVVGTNSCGATTETINVVFLTAPTVSVSSNVSLICPGETATLTASGNQSPATYSWSSSTNTTNIEIVSAGGIYTVTNANICGLADATVSIVQSTLTPDFIFSPNGGTAPVTINFTNTSVNNNSNLWNFGNATSGTGVNGSANYTSPGIYTITLNIQNSDGCFANVTKTIEVTESGFGIIPELVTPNGDGKNETFEVKGISKYPNSDLEIYNRWGNLVFSKAPYDNSWDGSANFNGNSKGKLPVGTYYFILKLNDSEGKIFKGYVQLQY